TDDITLVKGWNWYTGSDPGAVGQDQYDFETVAMHELGHGIGLGHSADAVSVMYATLASGVGKRNFTANDLTLIDNDNNTAGHALRVAGWQQVTGGLHAGQNQDDFPMVATHELALAPTLVTTGTAGASLADHGIVLLGEGMGLRT